MACTRVGLVLLGRVGGGHEYVVRSQSAGPRAPIRAATSAIRASACATRRRLPEASAERFIRVSRRCSATCDPGSSAGARAGRRTASRAACGGRGGRSGARTSAVRPRPARRCPDCGSASGESSSCSASRSSPLSHSATGMPKPFFGAVGDPGGRTSRHRALEQVLRLEAAQLESRRARGQELDELDVEERRPHLERARHARAVDLHEDVVLQVRLRVQVDQSLDPVLASAALANSAAAPRTDRSAPRVAAPPARRG